MLHLRFDGISSSEVDRKHVKNQMLRTKRYAAQKSLVWRTITNDTRNSEPHFHHSHLNLHHINMSFILNNYTDLYVINGLVEASAGVFALLLPGVFFWGSERNPHALLLARWWASSVIAIGLISLLVSTRTCLFLQFTAFQSH